MGWDLAATTTPKARKEYHCNASDWIDQSGGGECDFEPEDWVIIQKAKAEGNKILPGTRYVKTTGKWEGEFSTFRARIDLDKICEKYELHYD